MTFELSDGNKQSHAGRELPKGDNPKRQLSNCQAGPTASSTPLLLNAQIPLGGHPLCGRPAGYLPPGTVGQRPPATIQWRTESRAATRKPTRRGRLGPRAGIPKRKLSNLKPSAWAAPTHCEGKGPENPASWRHWLMRSHTSAFSSPSRATLSSPSTPQILPLCSGLVVCCGAPDVKRNVA